MTPTKIFFVPRLSMVLPLLLAMTSLVSQAQAQTQTVNSDPHNVALVYNGPGACEEDCIPAATDRAMHLGFEVRLINEKNWSESLFDGAKIWIQPGGHSGVVADTLSPEHKSRLRRFVAEGGGYVGYCAGGFFASKTVHEADGHPYHHELLGIIPLVTQVYAQPTDASLLHINWLGTVREMYWEGGPFFMVPSPANVEVIAYYENGQVVSVRTTYGKGRVFVSGTHPEAPQEWFDYYHLQNGSLAFDLAESMITWATAPH